MLFAELQEGKDLDAPAPPSCYFEIGTVTRFTFIQY